MRAAIAVAMSRSKREIPHYYLSNTVDVGAATAFIGTMNAERPPERRLLLGALFVKATAMAAKTFPEFNGAFETGAYRPSAAIHVGVAISIRGGGLVAPAIHDVVDLALDDLMAAMRDLIGRVRAGRFRSSEIADPTITVSSLGERGVEALYGVIYPPQVAIVGFGKVVERPWVVGAALVARPLVTTTLAADHRVSDGHRGALFLAKIGELLQRPEAL
jgi:pyruvate dehydrogenase E2 component (dihydrolipoamide acetyltransferase)